MDEWTAAVDDRRETEHWDWAAKLDAIEGKQHWTFYALCEGERCHGMMILSWPDRSRISENDRLLYVEYLEVAPWNRGDIAQKRDLLGVGSALIEVAVRASNSVGLEGRVGLHSLPEAERFYRKLKFRDYGPDAHHDALRYFELDAVSETRNGNEIA